MIFFLQNSSIYLYLSILKAEDCCGSTTYIDAYILLPYCRSSYLQPNLKKKSNFSSLFFFWCRLDDTKLWREGGRMTGHLKPCWRIMRRSRAEEGCKTPHNMPGREKTRKLVWRRIKNLTALKKSSVLTIVQLRIFIAIQIAYCSLHATKCSLQRGH